MSSASARTFTMPSLTRRLSSATTMRSVIRCRSYRPATLARSQCSPNATLTGAHAPGEAPMYAIIQTGGKQYRVAQGDRLDVERLDASGEGELSLRPVLLVDGDDVLATPQQ